VLPAVPGGCETSHPTSTAKHRLRMFENRVPRMMCGPKREEVTEDWRRLHNEQLRGLCCSVHIIGLIKSRRWAGYVARMAKKRSTNRVLCGNLKERDRLEDLGVYERIILKWISRKQDATTWNGLALLWIGATGRLL
jgi:hypothetical protein